MLIHQEKPDNKKRFLAHLSRDEMVMLERALGMYGSHWDDDKAWELSYQIEKLLASTHITIEDMMAEEEALKNKT